MREIAFFSLGFVLAIVMFITVGFVLKYSKDDNTEADKTNTTPSPEEAERQKELERQYNNMLNYNGSSQRGADDED